MSLKRGILGLLSLKPMGGYDLVKTFNSSLKYFWSAQSSQIYRELDDLSAAGFIRTEMKTQRGRMTKTLFAPTEKGLEELDRWLRESALERPRIRNPFLLRLFFQARCGEDSVRALVEEKKARVEAEAAQLRRVLEETIPQRSSQAGDELTTLCWKEAAEYGIASCEAEIRWAEAFLARIGAHEGEGS